MAIIDPTTGALTSGPGDLSQYGFPGFGGGGGLLGGGSDFSNPLLTFGAGLLARSGPSLTPQSPWGAIGQSLTLIPEAQQKSLENQMRRQALLETAQEQQGLQRIQDFVKNNPQLMEDQPLLGGLLSTGYKPAIQGVATALSDPNFAVNLAANRAKVAGDAATNVNNYQNAYTGEQAIAVLRDHPGVGEALIKSPLVLQIAQGAKSAGDVLPQLKALLPKDLSDKDAAAVLDAASTLVASRDALVEQGGIKGDTSNVGLGFYERAFKQARERAEAIAKAGGKSFDLPPPPLVAFGSPQPTATTTATTTPPAETTAPPPPGSIGVQNGRIVPQPATVYKDLPPAEPAAAEPPAVAPPVVQPPAEPFYTGPLRRTGTAIGAAFDRLFGGSPSPASPAPAPAATPASAPVATPAPAPAATLPMRVQSLRYSPTTGLVMFRSKDEFNRAVKNGSLIKAMPNGGQVEIGGVTYPVTLGATGG